MNKASLRGTHLSCMRPSGGWALAGATGKVPGCIWVGRAHPRRSRHRRGGQGGAWHREGQSYGTERHGAARSGGNFENEATVKIEEEGRDAKGTTGESSTNHSESASNRTSNSRCKVVVRKAKETQPKCQILGHSKRHKGT